jgi:hypothetical protein
MHFSFLESAAARLDGISRTGTAAYIGPKQHCNYLAASSELTYSACIHGSLLCICPSQSLRREGMLSLFLFLVLCLFGLITHVM